MSKITFPKFKLPQDRKTKKKWFIAFIIIALLLSPIWFPIVLLLLPFLIAGFLIWLTFKKLNPSRLRPVIVCVLVIISLIVMSSWVNAINTVFPSSEKTKVAEKPKQEEQIAEENQEEIKEESKQEPETKEEPKVAGETTQKETAPQEENQNLVLVKRVVDGDTIELDNGDKLRYIGIDTPETVHPSKPVECFGKEASNKNKELVEGKKVRLEQDVTDRDKYDRLLRYVYLENGTFVNLLLVKEGYATSYSYPPDIKYQNQIIQAEQEARNNNRGLWGTCNQQEESTPEQTSQPANTNNNTSNNNSDSNQSSGQCLIKGNISSSGEKIYHVPGQQFYDKTVIDESKGERWFCTEQEAQNAGWRKSKR